MIKLGKTARIYLAGGIFVILLVSLVVAYSQQAREQDRLHQELSQAQLLLTKYSLEELSSQQRELESQLAQVESELEDSKARLRQSIESIEATDTLFQLAVIGDVEIIDISSPGLTIKELEGFTFSVLTLTATVEGEVSSLIGYIAGMTGKFPTGVVESVKIYVPEVIEGETPAKPSATIELSVYTYEGD